MATEKFELLQGTLDLLILTALQHDAMHGFGLSQRIHVMSGEVFLVEMGSLYPVPVRGKGMDQGRMERLGRQPQGSVLFADLRRQEAVDGGDGEVGEAFEHHQPDA
jgi:hypothetical protein